MRAHPVMIAAVTIGSFAYDVAVASQDHVHCAQRDVQMCRERFVAQGWKRRLEGSDVKWVADANNHYEVWERDGEALLCTTRYIRSVISDMSCMPLKRVQ